MNAQWSYRCCGMFFSCSNESTAAWAGPPVAPSLRFTSYIGERCLVGDSHGVRLVFTKFWFLLFQHCTFFCCCVFNAFMLLLFPLLADGSNCHDCCLVAAWRLAGSGGVFFGWNLVGFIAWKEWLRVCSGCFLK